MSAKIKCECGEWFGNNPGAMATHKNGNKHKLNMDRLKQI